MQRLADGPLGIAAEAAGSDLWLDGGHNPHAARALADTLATLKARDGRPVVLIAGLLGNKDAGGFFEAFRDLDPRVLTTGFEADAASATADLADIARAKGLRADACVDAAAAVARAISEGGPPPHICIAGSLYLVGEVLALSPKTWPR